MGYAVHIRRASGRIELAEWTAFAAAADDLTESGQVERAGKQIPVYVWKDAAFVWDDGQIVVDQMSDEWRKKLGDVANRLGAEAIGDDGERYFADGRVDYGEGPESIQGVRTLAAFRYVPPSRQAKKRQVTRLVVVLAITALVVVAVVGFLLVLRGSVARP